MEETSPAPPFRFPPGTKHEHPRKRIVVCCDGTWQNSDQDVEAPSNVTRICRAIPSYGHDHSTSPPKAIAQITYYQNGIGTGTNGLYDKLVGGVTGEGISLNIREAYAFVCQNYNPGDEIFLIGFSRGAFTARSISTLIRSIGLLTQYGLMYLVQIFEDWKYQLRKGWKSRFPDQPWSNRPPVGSPAYKRKLLELELTRPNIPIKCVAVWDTVGALGVPSIGLLPQQPSTDFSFVDTKVEQNIEYAFQALALDEHRRSYHPTIWEKSDGQEWPRVLKQTWFPGVHSDVGGSYTDDDLSNLTLAWMVGNLGDYGLLDFNYDYVIRQVRMSMQRKEAQNKPVRTWGLGKIHNSMSLFFWLGGSKIRTPKEYFATDRQTGSSTGHRLENTEETIHSSVRIRMGREGLGYNDKGKYDSSALQGWTMHGTTPEVDQVTHDKKNDDRIRSDSDSEADPDSNSDSSTPAVSVPGRMTNVVWRKKLSPPHSPGSTKSTPNFEMVLEMPEDQLTHFEHEMLRLWPNLEQDFDTVLPGGHKKHICRTETDPTAAAASAPASATEPVHNPLLLRDCSVEEEERRRRKPSPSRIGTM